MLPKKSQLFNNVTNAAAFITSEPSFLLHRVHDENDAESWILLAIKAKVVFDCRKNFRKKTMKNKRKIDFTNTNEDSVFNVCKINPIEQKFLQAIKCNLNK